MSDFLRQFAPTFATLDKHNLHLLGRLYSEDVAFADPLHEVQGLPALQRYFADLYSNVSELSALILRQIDNESSFVCRAGYAPTDPRCTPRYTPMKFGVDEPWPEGCEPSGSEA